MQVQEVDTIAGQEVVRAQLTLRAVVWDISKAEDVDTGRLERETVYFGIYRMAVQEEAGEGGNGKNQGEQTGKEGNGKNCKEHKKEEGYRKKYGEVLEGLREAGILEEEAVLVTQDAGMAGYVYGLRKCSGENGTEDMHGLKRSSHGKGTEYAYGLGKSSEEKEPGYVHGLGKSSEEKEPGYVHGLGKSSEEKEAGYVHGLGKSSEEKGEECVYGLGKCTGEGMGVVYYEKEGGRRDVAADFVVLGFEEVGVQFLDRIQKRRMRLPWNILYTKRTCVREITVADLDELYALYEGEGITDYTEPLFEREKEEEYTKSYIACMYYYYGYGMWIIRDRESGKLLGRAGIEHREVEDGVWMELGYIIGREYQNQGYATEVCQAILAYAQEELAIEELHCLIHPDNLASIHLAEKLGFGLCADFGGGQGELLHFCRKNIFP